MRWSIRGQVFTWAREPFEFTATATPTEMNRLGRGDLSRRLTLPDGAMIQASCPWLSS